MTSKRGICVNDPDIFCYICGGYMRKEHRFNVREFTKRACHAYFDLKLGDQDRRWAPHKVCKNCTENLRFWTQGKAKAMRFGVPMVWREPKNHQDDCYFCSCECVRVESTQKGFVVLPWHWVYKAAGGTLRGSTYSSIFFFATAWFKWWIVYRNGRDRQRWYVWYNCRMAKVRWSVSLRANSMTSSET